ncbi:MAG: hypothetical protein RIC30_13700 [Marinoscillum sp.]|uniref:hypothetical protein n=1 Tax=Marinoscillum sp. TaxID=2024838 RepID=UPI0032FFF97C
MPPSPEAASLGTYGNHEVDMAYGTPRISIPLFEVRSGALSVPVSLSYNAGGNKVADEGSWVGLGWALNASGVVSRTVRGAVDERITYNIQHDDEWFVSDPSFSELQSAAAGSIETQADLFSFNFPGYSGTFYFGSGGVPLLIPYQPLEITPTYQSGHLVKFVIETPDRIIYTFSDSESQKPEVAEGASGEAYVSSWYLTSIVHPNSDRIDFTYETLADKITRPVNIHSINYKAEYNNYGQDGLQSQAYSTRVVGPKRIKKIDFAGGHAEIHPAGIDVFNDNQSPAELCYDINFTINTFAKSSECSTSGVSNCDRKKLTQVSINDQEYSFTYNSIPQPPYNTFDKDHWGYYNGADNSSPIPDVRWGTQTLGGGADREVNETFAKFGILERVDYPTGGYSLYTYESNRVSDVNWSEGGQRVEFDASFVKKLSHDGNGVDTQENYDWPIPVLLDDPQGAGGTGSPTVRWYPELEIKLEYAVLKGYTLPKTPKFIFTVNGSDLVNTNYNTYDFIDDVNDPTYDIRYKTFHETFGAASYTDDEKDGTVFMLTSGDYNGSGPQNYVKATITRTGYYYEKPTEGSAILVGGLRIQAIKNYDKGGALLSKKTYKYVIPDEELPSNLKGATVQSGELLDGRLEDATDKSAYYSYYGMVERSYNELCEELEYPNRVIVHDNPSSRFSTGTPVGYEYVTEYTESTKSGGPLGRTVNKYYMIPDVFSGYIARPEFGDHPQVPSISRSHQRGQLTNSWIYDAEGSLQREVSYQYASWGTSRTLNGAVVMKNRAYDPSQDGCGQPGEDMLRFLYATYNVGELSRSRITKKTTIEHFALNESDTTIEDYLYTSDDTYRLLKSVKTTKGTQIYQKEYTYEYELGGPGIPTNMRENRVRLGEDVIAAKRMDYLLSLPQRVYQWRGAEPDGGFSNFDGVNSDDGYPGEPDIVVDYVNYKPRVVHDESGLSTVYLWNNTSQLLATISNCDASNKVAFYDFGCPPTNFYSVGSHIDDNPFTGGWSYGLAYGDLISKDLAKGKYIVEYWEDQSFTTNTQVTSTSSGGAQVTMTFVDDPPYGTWSRKFGILDWSHLAEGATFNVRLSGNSHIDVVRIYPYDAAFTNYIQHVFYGTESMIGPDGSVINYQYDSNGRLKEVKDQEGYHLQNYDYNLIGN